MNRRFSAAVVAASVALAMLVAAAPARADNLLARCKTAGAAGGLTVYNFSGATDRIKLFIGVSDTRADGHHVRVRLLTKNVNGTTKRWRWRSVTQGADESRDWRTTAKDDRGIFAAGLQVARYEHGTILNSCVDWAD